MTLGNMEVKQQCNACKRLSSPGNQVCMLQNLGKDLGKPHLIPGEPLATVMRYIGICPNSEIAQAVIQIVNSLTRT